MAMNLFSMPHNGPQDFSSPGAWKPAAQGLVFGSEPSLQVGPPCPAFLKTVLCQVSWFCFLFCFVFLFVFMHIGNLSETQAGYEMGIF